MRNRPRLGGALVIGILAVATASGWVWAGGRPAGPALVLGGSVPIDPVRAADSLDTTAENSPSVVVNPRDPADLVVVSRVDSPQFSCTVRVSRDGGATWRPTAIPAPPGTPAFACFGPDAAFDADGTLYVSFTSAGQVPGQGTAPDAVWIAASHDGGQSLATPARAGGPLAFQVRVAADPAHAGRVYLSWLQAEETSRWGLVGTTNPILASRSDDGGQTWSEPVRVSAGSRSLVVAPVPAVAGDGEVVVVYLDVGDDRLDYEGAHEGKGGEPYPGPWWLVAARSADGGATWQEATVDRLVPFQRFLQLFPPTPSVAVAGRRIYLAFGDGRLGDVDVWVWASSDAGRRWTAARRVNDVRQGDQYLPAASVAPDGRLDVVYYDRRADPGGSMTEVSLQSSRDHARTFGPRTDLSDRPFDAAIGLGADRGLPELGTRLALVAHDARSLAIWADTRAGNPATMRQDLADGVVSVPPHGGWERRVRDASAALAFVGAGAVIGLLALRVRRRNYATVADAATSALVHDGPMRGPSLEGGEVTGEG